MPEIPWQCWESLGFKACHAKQWREATRLCELGAEQSYDGDVPRCVHEGTIILALRNCSSLCRPADTQHPQQMPGVPGPGTPMLEPGSEQVFKPGINLSTNAKIMLGGTAAVIVVLLVTRRK